MQRKKWTKAQHEKYRATMAAKKTDKKQSPRAQRQRPREFVMVTENGQLARYRVTMVEMLELIED